MHHALDAAESLAGQGIDAEVIDLRSLVPLDREAILRSVAKTGRLVVVDEDYQSFGLSGEVVATITDVDPSMLRAPVARVANPDVPVPLPTRWNTPSCRASTGSRKPSVTWPGQDRDPLPRAVQGGSAGRRRPGQLVRLRGDTVQGTPIARVE